MKSLPLPGIYYSLPSVPTLSHLARMLQWQNHLYAIGSFCAIERASLEKAPVFWAATSHTMGAWLGNQSTNWISVSTYSLQQTPTTGFLSFQPDCSNYGT